MSHINDLGNDKYFANRGVNRNKRPIANLIYKVTLSQLSEKAKEHIADFEKYMFKDLGYITLSWTKSKANKDGSFNWNWHGFITIAELKNRIGEKQYAKFCEGKREFIIQRRVDGKNIQK